ncbi:MAG: hypothetical protein D6730_01855 [Bacteroidetes bacterium]|nr:MAG: hypothetical protein D6730_01855 [Bacteroidota bacterium]
MKQLCMLALIMYVFQTATYAQRPYALGSFPNDGATHLFCHTFVRVHIHFPGEGTRIDPLTLNQENVKLYPTGHPLKQVRAQLLYDQSFQYIHLRPLEVLQPNTTYTFEITPGLMDERGKSFLAYRMTFTTGDCQQETVVSRGNEENPPEAEPEPEIPHPYITFGTLNTEVIRHQVRFDWETQSEFMQASFELRRSGDGKSFSPVASIESQGDSEDLQHYHVLDSNLQYGFNYYAFTAYDVYGKVSFSDTLMVFRERIRLLQDSLRLGEALQVDILVAPRTSMAFVLRNEQQKEVIRKAAFLPHDKPRFQIPIDNVPPGTYQALLITPQSRVEKMIRVVE